MGCSSSSPTPAHALCLKAFESKKPIDVTKLEVAVKGLDAAQLNAKASNWTCLDIIALCEDSEASGRAAEIVLAAGADPLSGADGDSAQQFSTAIGKCIKYGNLSVLAKCLKSLDASGWDKFTEALAKPIVCNKTAAVGEGLWVSVNGKKGKTGVLQDFNPIGTDRYGVPSFVTYEDGSCDGAVSSEKITILPQAPSKVLELLHAMATDTSLAIDTKTVLKRITSMEETDRTLEGTFKCSFLVGGMMAIPGGY